ncbi:unnamed protein product, partial [Closterium sp. NIES-53]
KGGEFSSDLLRAFCRAEGIHQAFTPLASPQQNGIAERRIGMVMDVALRCASDQPSALCLLAGDHTYPETTPTLRWTGKVGDASGFRVWASRAFVRDTSTDKLSSSAVPCIFLGFPPDAPGWQFYHPTSWRVLSSQDVTFDESVSYYRTPPVDPLPPQCPAPSGVSQVDPAKPVEVAVDSGAARGAEPAGAGAEPEGADPECVEPGGAMSGGAESGGSPVVLLRQEPLSPQRLREWYARHCRRAAGAGDAGGAAGASAAGGAAGTAGGAAGAGAAGGTVGAGASGGAAGADAAGGFAGAGAAGGAAGAGGAGGATGAEAAGPNGAAGVVAGDPGAEGTGAVSAVSGGAAKSRPYYVPLLQQVLGLPPSPGPPPLPSPQPSRPVLPVSRSLSSVRTTRAGRVLRPRPPPVPGTHSMTLRPSTAPQRVPLPSPPASSLPVGPDPESDSLRAASPTVPRFLATAITNPLFESSAASALVAELVDFAAACRPDFATSLVAESSSMSVCPPSVGGECALGTDILEDRQEEFECFAAAVPHLVSMLLAPEGDPDALVIPTPRSYAEAIEGPYSSQCQRQGVDFFQTFSPTPKMTTLRVLLHVATQRDYELHSLDFSTAFLQGSLHEEIWLRRPPGLTGSFPAGTQWSLRRPLYGLHQAPREWHDTLRTTLAALGFAPSSADPSLFLRIDTTLPLFYVLVYVDDLVFATADIEALAHLKSKLQKRHTCTDLGEVTSYLGLRITWDRAQHTITLTQSHMVQQVLQRFGFMYSLPQSTPLPTGHSLSAPPSDESVEPSGPYPELVGCLMYLMTCTRPDLAYPLSLLSRYVAPGRHRKVHWDAAKRVLRYLCSTSGMGLVLGGQARVVLTGHAYASWSRSIPLDRSCWWAYHLLASAATTTTTLCAARPVACGSFFFPPCAPGRTAVLCPPCAPRRAAVLCPLCAPRRAAGFCPVIRRGALWRRRDGRRGPARRPPSPVVAYARPVRAACGPYGLRQARAQLVRAAPGPRMTRTGGARPARGPYGPRQARARLGPPERGSGVCTRPVVGPFLAAPAFPAVPPCFYWSPTLPTPHSPELGFGGEGYGGDLIVCRSLLLLLLRLPVLQLPLRGGGCVGAGGVVLKGGSSCEAEIYAGAMAAQELRWLTYLLTDLGEAPRSPPVLYVDNKAMLALCQEHKLEHRTKHISLRYFLARELQHHGQLRLAYVASQANTADVFTKALQPCDHQRFCTVLGLVPTVPHLLTS